MENKLIKIGNHIINIDSITYVMWEDNKNNEDKEEEELYIFFQSGNTGTLYLSGEEAKKVWNYLYTLSHKLELAMGSISPKGSPKQTT